MSPKHSDPTRTELERFALECFEFLVSEEGFRRGRKERNVWYTKTYYLNANIGISVMVQYLDPVIQVHLIKTLQSNLLPDWNHHVVTRRWHRPFQLAVQNVLHVSDERLQRLDRLERTPQPWEPSVFEAILSAYSGLVKDYLDALGAYPPETLFPEPPTKR